VRRNRKGSSQMPQVPAPKCANQESPQEAPTSLHPAGLPKCATVASDGPKPGSAFVAFVAEHQRCDVLDGGVDNGYVWIQCSCGGLIMHPASEPPKTNSPRSKKR
jgi:hypothetical protein